MSTNMIEQTSALKTRITLNIRRVRANLEQLEAQLAAVIEMEKQQLDLFQQNKKK